MQRPAMKRPSSARAVAKAKGKTTTKGIGKDKGKGKGEKGDGKGKGKMGDSSHADDDAAPTAAIRAEADATVARTRDALMFIQSAHRLSMALILDMHRQHANNRARFVARRLSMELDSRDWNAH